MQQNTDNIQLQINNRLINKHITRFGLFIFIYSAMRLLASFLYSFLNYIGFTSLFPPSWNYSIQLAVSSFCFYVIPLLPFYFIFPHKLFKRNNKKYIGSEYSKLKAFSFYPTSYALAIGTSLFTVISIFIIALIFRFPISAESISEYFAEGDANIFFKLLIIAFIAPIMEEFYFRGVLLGTLRPFGDRFAIITSALFFGIMHGNIMQAPFATVIGLVFGYIYIRSNSLSVTIGFHILINSTSTILGYFTEKVSTISILNGVDKITSNDIAWILLYLGFIFFIFGIIIWGIVIFIIYLVKYISGIMNKRHISYLENDFYGFTEGKKFAKFFTNPFVISALCLCLFYIVISTIGFINSCSLQ